MRKILIVIVASSALAACAEKQISELSYPQQQALAKQIFDRCTKEAPPAGSPQHRYCFNLYIQQEQQRRQQSAARANGAMAGIAEGLAGSGQAWNNGAYSATPAYRPPVYCSSNVSGGYTSNPTLNTTCY